MDENLVGYLLNSLDADSHRQMESYLQTDPDAQRRLDLLRRALEPLALDAEDEPAPPGLWVHTLGHIARHQCRQETELAAASAAGAPPRPYRSLPAAPRWSREGGPSRSWWRRADVLVAAVVLVAFAGTVLAFLPGLWHRQQIYACQNNLRLFHVALTDYSERHNGAFPKVEAEPPRNVAGIFVPMLRDAGALPSDVTISCPANGDRQVPDVSLAELERMQQAHPVRFNDMLRRLAGCYAYTLGYGDAGAHCGLRCDDDDYLPILADKPNSVAEYVKPGNSPNHGGQGQNVLYIGGHVRFSTVRNVGVEGDDIYVNQQGKVAAGRNRYDSVLGASWTTPYPPEQ